MKKFGKVLAMVMVALMMMSTAAFADANKDGVSSAGSVGENDIVTVVLSGLKIGEEATILVVNEGTKLADITSENASSTILYIDQLTAVAAADGETGTVTFTLDASAAAVSEEEETVGRKAVDVYCGYTNMTVADPVMTTVVLAEGGQSIPKFVYGDVDGNGVINATDAGWVLTKYGDKDTVYPCGVDAAGDVDGNGVTNATDAGWILTKYGDKDTVFPVEEAK